MVRTITKAEVDSAIKTVEDYIRAQKLRKLLRVRQKADALNELTHDDYIASLSFTYSYKFKQYSLIDYRPAKRDIIYFNGQTFVSMMLNAINITGQNDYNNIVFDTAKNVIDSENKRLRVYEVPLYDRKQFDQTVNGYTFHVFYDIDCNQYHGANLINYMSDRLSKRRDLFDVLQRYNLRIHYDKILDANNNVIVNLKNAINAYAPNKINAGREVTRIIDKRNGIPHIMHTEAQQLDESNKDVIRVTIPVNNIATYFTHETKMMFNNYSHGKYVDFDAFARKNKFDQVQNSIKFFPANFHRQFFRVEPIEVFESMHTDDLVIYQLIRDIEKAYNV